MFSFVGVVSHVVCMFCVSTSQVDKNNKTASWLPDNRPFCDQLTILVSIELPFANTVGRGEVLWDFCLSDFSGCRPFSSTL